MRIKFEQTCRLPDEQDNVAIATRRVEAGTEVEASGGIYSISHTVLEGHRFVVKPVAQGERLLSWGLPFGTALRDIAPGEYVCNAKILSALAERDIDFELPIAANFEDFLQVYELDETSFEAGQQLPSVEDAYTFDGFKRPGNRGVGTRNFIVVLAVTEAAAGFARQVASRFDGACASLNNVDGIVAVTHTEGSAGSHPNNRDFVMRTLAGFCVHPNIGAVLAVDYGDGAWDNAALKAFLEQGNYPLQHIEHEFFNIETDQASALDRAAETIDAWLPLVQAVEREPQPAAELSIALQCGGSDAFSGVSGNALAGRVAREVIQRGGRANLAETDELIGAEPYVLSNVRNSETARRFLEKIQVFKDRAADHGTSAEGNPSGGNNFRGLYNIALKSIGAARKKAPDVRLDYVVDYGEPMPEPGYYFMDSPGNDLESIAGQVASGSNLIFFITGNGSITNFPFVPTLKFVTTTGRFEMLENEMDVNAGRYNDGESMNSLGIEIFELALKISSGQPSKGELAGHSQVQIWRDWPQANDRELNALKTAPVLADKPLPHKPATAIDIAASGYRSGKGFGIEQVGLVMPTSLCSGQVARLIAEQLSEDGHMADAVSRYVALVHTEGCGSNNAEELYLDTLIGYLQHPSIAHAVLVEHGCERTHNDAIRHHLERAGMQVDEFDWASVQMDGGLKLVSAKVRNQFNDRLSGQIARPGQGGSKDLAIGVMSAGPVSDITLQSLARVVTGLAQASATVVIPSNASLLATGEFTDAVFVGESDASLGYGRRAAEAGIYIMDAPTENVTETITGLAATGVDVIVHHAGVRPAHGHPLVPCVQISSNPEVSSKFHSDLDLILQPENMQPEHCVEAIIELLQGIVSGSQKPILYGDRPGSGNSEFQLTRGRLGISM